MYKKESMKRNIISIDEEKCNGCALCVKGCHEGALQMIDNKARIVSELYCDGLGACIGDCPVGAITIIEREAEPYDEIAVMERLSKKGEETILANLKHLKDHNETEYLNQGIDYIKRNNIDVDLSKMEDKSKKMPCGCPGSMARSFVAPAKPVFNKENSNQQSALSHWPVQLHLLNPSTSYFKGADVVLAADCTAYAFADFHDRFLRGKKLAIACPKLDIDKEEYIEKITEMIDSARINTLTVVIMEVPCCGGLMQIANLALSRATRKIPVKKIVVGVQGDIVSDEWV